MKLDKSTLGTTELKTNEEINVGISIMEVTTSTDVADTEGRADDSDTGASVDEAEDASSELVSVTKELIELAPTLKVLVRSTLEAIEEGSREETEINDPLEKGMLVSKIDDSTVNEGSKL